MKKGRYNYQGNLAIYNGTSDVFKDIDANELVPVEMLSYLAEYIGPLEEDDDEEYD